MTILKFQNLILRLDFRYVFIDACHSIVLLQVDKDKIMESAKVYGKSPYGERIIPTIMHLLDARYS